MSYVSMHGAPLGAAAPAATSAAGLQAGFAVLARANADLAQALRPFAGAIDRLPAPATPRFKELLKTKPLDALVEWLTPWEDVAKDTITLANRLSGRQVRLIGLPGKKVQADMRWEWPDDAVIADKSLRTFIQRLRTINNWMIYVLYDPGHLAVAFTQTLAQALKGVARDIGTEAQRVAAEAQRKLQASAESGKSSVTDVVDKLSQAFGIGAFPAAAAAGGGGGGASAGSTAATSVPVVDSTAKIAGVAITPGVVIAICGVIVAIVTASGGALSSMAPVAAGAIKAQSASGQKNPYVDMSNVATQKVAEKASGGIPTWAIGLGIGAAVWALTRKSKK